MQSSKNERTIQTQEGPLRVSQDGDRLRMQQGDNPAFTMTKDQARRLTDTVEELSGSGSGSGSGSAR